MTYILKHCHSMPPETKLLHHGYILNRRTNSPLASKVANSTVPSNDTISEKFAYILGQTNNETFSDDGVSTLVSDDDQISLEISVALLASETSTATKHLKPSVMAISALSTPKENMKDSDMMSVSTTLFPQANNIDLSPSLSTLIFDDPFYVLASFETENLMVTWKHH